MTTLKGSATHENLKTAFANEAQANRRYLYFARQADVEGFPEIAGLFRDTAEGEAGHAHGFLDFRRKVGDPLTGLPIGTTPTNLEAAIAREIFECTKLYPEMAAAARAEGFAEIADWFDRLTKAERNHSERFRRGLDSIGKMERENKAS